MEKYVKNSLTKRGLPPKTQEGPSTNIDFDASSFSTSANKSDVVGTGSYGVVRRCYHDHLKNIVVKCMYCGGSVDSISSSIDEARKQIRFLTQLKHPHIVQTYGITSWDQCFGIIMEEIKCGNLRNLTVLKNIEIDWKLRFRIIFQLADALKYLHFHNPRKSYVHLDIKPENILLTMNLSVKLADFGSLEIAIVTGATSTTAETSSHNQYTPLYTAPERLQDISGSKAKSSMDVYSFAMICYEMMTGQAVFHDVRANVSLLISLIASCGQKPTTKLIDDMERKLKQQNIADSKIFLQLRSIMEKCWCFEPKNRLSMKQVCKTLVDFCGCYDPYKSDIESNIDEIATTLLQNQTQVVPFDKEVPLKLHRQPFYEVVDARAGLASSFKPPKGITWPRRSKKFQI